MCSTPNLHEYSITTTSINNRFWWSLPPKVALLTSWIVELDNPRYPGLPRNMPVNFAGLQVQIRLNIWIQPGYLGMCYYQSSQGPLPTLPALPLWEGSSVRQAGVQSLSAWGVWRMLSWSCEPPDSRVYCLREGRGREGRREKKERRKKRHILLSINLLNKKFKCA